MSSSTLSRAAAMATSSRIISWFEPGEAFFVSTARRSDSPSSQSWKAAPRSVRCSKSTSLLEPEMISTRRSESSTIKNRTILTASDVLPLPAGPHTSARSFCGPSSARHLRCHGLGVDLLVDLDGRHGLLEDGQCDLRAEAAALDLALAALVADHAHAVSCP